MEPLASPLAKLPSAGHEACPARILVVDDDRSIPRTMNVNLAAAPA